MIYREIKHRNKTTDTDGDGVSDYDEMTLRRCPMTKGPLPRELTPEEQAAATARGEELRKAAETAKLERLMPKLQAGLETARRKGPADRVSDWLTADLQMADLAELALLAKDREEQHRLNAEARMAPGPIKDLIDRGDISVRRIGPDGVPQLVGSYDLAGADTISTDDLWPGGTANNLPDLSGTGRFIGIWEAGGYPFSPHIEFDPGTGSKVFVNDTTSPTVTVKSHATQVAGVMAAAGLLPSARGMSFDSSLLASTDIGEFSETAAAAAAGMTLSNHSYGDYAGWHYFPQFSNLQWVWTGENVTGEDKRFGFYNTDSRKIDLVTYGAPGYLPVYASGNDVADTGPAAGEMHWWYNPATSSYTTTSTAHPVDGGGTGFDTLTGRACSLNSLAVGSVYPVSGGYQGGTVVISPFSSRGPTDDGRIKPDLVASGEEVVSSQLETAQAYAVQNSSFEAANLAVGGSTTTTANWQQLLASGGEARVWRIQYSGGFNFAGLGTHALGLTNTGTRVYQDLPGVTLQPNTTYNVNFRVGRLNTYTDPSTVFWVRLYANGFGSLVKSFQIAANSIPVDQFLDGTLTFDAPVNPPVGALRIVLEHGGPNTVAANGNNNYAFFDWVRIEKAHNPSALPTNLYTDGSVYGREKVAGTSFATPAATGSLNLLQEQLQQAGGGTLWGSASKALAIGTADDVGNTGPDYTYGWGLMNTRKAAEHLARHLASQSRRSFIRQNTLFDGNTIEYKVKASGGEDMVATLAYAPPAYQNIATANENQGIPANTLDPTTSMLVNDVDIQIVRPDGTVIGPWLLDPSNPAANATAPAVGSDDDRNNVKQVRIPAAQVVAGQTYTIRVKQDGALKVAVKQPGTTNYTLTGSQPAQPAFQNFAVVTSGNVDRAEDGFKITDFDRVAGFNYIEWRSVKGIRYRIQTSLDLVNWTTLPGDIDATGETTSYTDQPADPGEAKRFYRVAEITP